MINWWLIVLAVIIGVLVLGISFYLLVYYGSEEDAGTAYGSKAIIVLGICLASGIVLLLPYDVAARVDPSKASKFTVNLDTETMWEVILWSAGVFILVLIPFTNYYYEAFDPDEDRPGKQVSQAAIYTAGIVLFFGALTAILWVTVGEAVIPYYSYICNAQFASPDHDSIVYYNNKSLEKFNLKVSIFVYAVAMLCAIGWVFFFIYGGVGLVAFPVDTIRDFMNRPKAVSATVFHQEMEVIASKAQVLLKIGEELTQASRRKSISGSLKNKINTLRNETFLLEAQQDRLIWAYEQAGGSPFVIYGSLFIGFIGAGISAMWIIHIFLYNTVKSHPFLNTMLIQLDTTFSLFGVAVYAVFAYYLLWATFKGQIKIGMRLLFFQIHPMKPNDTTVNSFLFNVGLLMISSIAVVQFSAMSFQEYAANTSISALLNVFVVRLKGIGPIISYMQYVFVGVSILSIFWVILCPNRQKREDLLKAKRPDEDD